MLKWQNSNSASIVIPNKNRAEAGSWKLQIWLKCGFSGKLILDTCKIAFHVDQLKLVVSIIPIRISREFLSIFR
jgi:hypothetical protein